MTRSAGPQSGATGEGMADAATAGGGAASYWRYTLWAMVGIQFVNTMANSVLTPIMPLFLPELGVRTESGIDIWAGILSGITSFVAEIGRAHV